MGEAVSGGAQQGCSGLGSREPGPVWIAVPELLYQMISIYNDYSTAQNACMVFLFFAYFILVGILVLGMHRWERKLRIPRYGA